MRKRQQRQGAIIVLAAICIVIVAAVLAFTVDLGLLIAARTEMQRSADSAAMAGAWQMVSDDVLRGETSAVDRAARFTAADLAAKNKVAQTSPRIDVNTDVRLGYLADPFNQKEKLTFPNPSKYNTVEVSIEYSDKKNIPITFFFAPLIGIKKGNLKVKAAATFDSTNTIGFRVTDDSNKCTLMPFTLKHEDWDALVNGSGDDKWSYDPKTQTVSPGPDGIPEMRMFPEKDSGSNRDKKNGTGITPGNFGTVDIGNTNNSAKDLLRQIREGPSADDLSYYKNNELKLDPASKTLSLNGDTGITASMKSALSDIVGKPRTITLYRDAVGQGDNTWFTIDGFAGMRVMDYSMTGKDKYILIQPAMVVDTTAISGNDSDTSSNIGPPVQLVR